MGLGSQFSSVELCPTLCDPMDCITPGFPVQHQLLELAQTHVHRVSDAIQPSHLLSSLFSCLQFFPASGSFPKSQFFASDSWARSLCPLCITEIRPELVIKVGQQCRDHGQEIQHRGELAVGAALKSRGLRRVTLCLPSGLQLP